MSEGNCESKDRLITVRFNSDVVGIIDELADEYRVSRSDIIRMAMDNTLSKHLDKVKFINTEQGKDINMNIVKLGNTMGEALYNIRKIGTNFDQLLKKVNSGQINDLQRSGDLISRKELDGIVKRMEIVAEKVGENLNVFQN